MRRYNVRSFDQSILDYIKVYLLLAATQLRFAGCNLDKPFLGKIYVLIL